MEGFVLQRAGMYCTAICLYLVFPIVYLTMIYFINDPVMWFLLKGIEEVMLALTSYVNLAGIVVL